MGTPHKSALPYKHAEITAQAPITVFYEEHVVGEYFADLFVSNAVIVELKAAKDLADEHEAQLLNYLKATPHEVGMLLNFGPKPQFKRKAFENVRKEWWIQENNPRLSARAASASHSLLPLCVIFLTQCVIIVVNAFAQTTLSLKSSMRSRSIRNLHSQIHIPRRPS